MRHVLKIGRLSVAALLAAGVAPGPEARRVEARGIGVTGARGRRPRRPRKAVAAPKIEITQETKDMGTVPKGQVIETDFVIKNTGGSDLVISDARPSLRLHGVLLRQGDQARRRGQGPHERRHQELLRPDLQVGARRLQRPRPPADEPLRQGDRQAVRRRRSRRQYVRFSVVKGDPASQDVILISEEKGFKPTVAETAQPYVKAEISPAGDKDKIAGRPGDQYKLNVSVTPDAPEGLLNAPVRVTTGVQQQPTLEIPVSGHRARRASRSRRSRSTSATSPRARTRSPATSS